jgi:molecular chaperone DnaK (HSP70)
MAKWAIDLGTSNTGLARWDDQSHRPRLLELPTICRKPQGADALEAPRLVPSATEVVPTDSLGCLLGPTRDHREARARTK